MTSAFALGISLTVGLGTYLAPVAQAADYRQSDVDAQVALLSSQSSQTRKQAAYHLSEMAKDAKRAVPALIETLQDPIAFGEAASALGKIGPDAGAAVPELIKCLGNTELGYDRCYVASALGGIGKSPELAVPALQKMVASDDDNTLRRLSAMALGDFGPEAKQSVGVLIEAVKTGDPEMRAAAARSIGQIGGADHDIPALVGLLSDEVDGARLGAVKALGRMGTEAVSGVPKLTDLLKDNSDEICLAAVQTLGAIGPEAKPAVPALKAALKVDKGDDFRSNVLDAIKKIEKRNRNQ